MGKKKNKAEEPLEELSEETPLESGDNAEASGEDTVESLRAECEDLRGRWQRAAADYANLRRRADSDLESRVKNRMTPLLESLLLVLDNLEMALKTPTDSADAKNLAIGVSMTRDQLLRSLEGEGVTPIESADAGADFDPERHQAMDTVTDTDVEPGAIVDVLRAGYTWRDNVLRYAQVRVAAKPAEDAAEEAAETPAER